MICVHVVAFTAFAIAESVSPALRLTREPPNGTDEPMFLHADHRMSGAPYHNSSLTDAPRLVPAIRDLRTEIIGVAARRALLAYIGAVTVMVLIICAMLYDKGLPIIVTVTVYLVSIGFIKISMKLVYAYDFMFPRFITAIHLFASSFASFIVLLIRARVSGSRIEVPTSHELIFVICPISFTFGLSIVTDNEALMFVSAAFAEVVSSTSVVFSAFLVVSFGMPMSPWLLLPMSLVVTGCAVTVSGELHFSTLGLVLVLVAVILRSLKATLQQKVLWGQTKEKFDAVTLLMWTCLVGFIELVAYSAATEGSEPLYVLISARDRNGLFWAILGSCAVAVALNTSALYVIEALGAVGSQMASQMKTVLVVIGGVALLHETFTMLQYFGFFLVLAGCFWYSHMKRELSTGMPNVDSARAADKSVNREPVVEAQPIHEKP